MVGLTNESAINTTIQVPALAPVAGTTSGTFSFDETSALAQTVTTITITARTAIGAIWLDMTNVTQDTNIALLHQIDGTNYRQFQDNAWVTTDDDGVLLDGFVVSGGLRITLTCGGGGGGSVNVPFVVL